MNTWVKEEVMGFVNFLSLMTNKSQQSILLMSECQTEMVESNSY
jgi:hypothetical protein